MGYVLNISIKDISSIVQICFYIVGATIAILTYRSARKGLLNTVNTEYQKRVMDHLDELSETLYAEFDEDSEIYWGRSDSDRRVEDIIKNVTDEYLEHLKEFGDSESFKSGAFQIPDIGDRLHKLSERVKSDPFLPDDITDYVVAYLVERRRIIIKVMEEETEILKENLRTENYSHLNLIPSIFSQRIHRKLYDNGMGIEHVEAEVHRIRNMIKEHLKSYNPLN